MSLLNVTQLMMTAHRNIVIADAVRQDPPVVKAAREFRHDVAQTVLSGGNLAREVQQSWRRHSL